MRLLPISIYLRAIRFPVKFNLDPVYELAKTIHELKGIPMTHSERFCPLRMEPGCAIYPREMTREVPSEEEILRLARKTLFAVKTAKKFHDERIPVLQETWASAAINLLFFSEEEDPRYAYLVRSCLDDVTFC